MNVARIIQIIVIIRDNVDDTSDSDNDNNVNDDDDRTDTISEIIADESEFISNEYAGDSLEW